MTDNTIDVVFTADTNSLQSSLAGINNALGYTKIAANNTSTPVQELFGTMQSASDKAIASMVKGTQNWQQSLSTIFQDLEIKFIQLNANKLLNTIETNALGVQSEQTSADQKVAANQAAASASSSANVGQVIKQIQSDAAATYAGVYAFLSPVLGPAAAVPAGISSAAVSAMEGLVSLDVGAWNLGSDMVAQLHQGEMVVPANFASGLRETGSLGGAGGGSGGDSYTINVNAIDTQTGAQFLRNNASVIAQTISSQVRSFNKNVPAWKS